MIKTKLGAITLLVVCALIFYTHLRPAYAFDTSISHEQPIEFESGSLGKIAIWANEYKGTPSRERAIIIDENDIIISYGPISSGLFVYCNRVDEGGTKCVAVDFEKQTIQTPEPSKFENLLPASGDRFNEIGPEDLAPEESRFSVRSASASEILKFQFLRAVANPVGTLLILAWCYALIKSFFFIFTKYESQHKETWVMLIVSSSLRLTTFITLSLVTFWLISALNLNQFIWAGTTVCIMMLAFNALKFIWNRPT